MATTATTVPLGKWAGIYAKHSLASVTTLAILHALTSVTDLVLSLYRHIENPNTMCVQVEVT